VQSSHFISSSSSTSTFFFDFGVFFSRFSFFSFLSCFIASSHFWQASFGASNPSISSGSSISGSFIYCSSFEPVFLPNLTIFRNSKPI